MKLTEIRIKYFLLLFFLLKKKFMIKKQILVFIGFKGVFQKFLIYKIKFKLTELKGENKNFHLKKNHTN